MHGYDHSTAISSTIAKHRWTGEAEAGAGCLLKREWCANYAWKWRTDRLWLAANTLSTLSAVMLTAYLVRAVNLKVFVAGPIVSQAERDRLLRTWYRLNSVRLLSVATAWLIAARLASRLRSPP